MEIRKFLHLIHRYYPFRGGSEQYFQSLSEQLAADGGDVYLITTDAWDLEYFWDPRRRRVEIPFERHNGVKIYRTPARHLPLANFSHRAIRRAMGEFSRLPTPGRDRILKSLSRFGPWLPDLPDTLDRVGHDANLIHAANIALESMISASACFAREREIPLVITPKLHLGESAASTVRRYYTMPHQLDLLRQADMIMTQTSVEADFIEQSGVPEDRIRVVGLGVNADEVTGGNEQRVRQALGIDGPIVLALGAAAYDKGAVHACQAVLAMNKRRAEPVTLVVAGPLLSNFQNYVDNLQADELRFIRVLGFVEDEMRTDLLAACEVLTLASRTEAFGYVFLEAWANGKPVVGARAGGIPAVVDDGVDGFLVEFGDVEALADSIGRIVDDPSLARSLGESGRLNKVVDSVAWYRKVRDVYAEVLGDLPASKGVADGGNVATR